MKVPEEEIAQEQKQSSLPDVHYLGFYRERSSNQIKLAAISNGGQIYVGGVKDILGQKYQLLQIGDEYLVLKVLAENKVLRVALGKNVPPPAELNGYTALSPQTRP